MTKAHSQHYAMNKDELIEALNILKEQAQHYEDNTFIWDVTKDSFDFVMDSVINALHKR